MKLFNKVRSIALVVFVISFWLILDNGTQVSADYEYKIDKLEIPELNWSPFLSSNESKDFAWTVSRDARKVLKINENGEYQVFDTLPPDGSSSWDTSSECAAPNNFSGFSKNAVDDGGNFYFPLSCQQDSNNPVLYPEDYLYKVSPTGDIEIFLINFDSVPPDYPTIAGVSNAIYGPDGNIWVQYSKDGIDSLTYFVRMNTDGQLIDVLTSPEPSWPWKQVVFNNELWFTDIRSSQESFYGTTNISGDFEKVFYSQKGVENFYGTDLTTIDNKSKIIFIGVSKDYTGGSDIPLSIIKLDSGSNLIDKKDITLNSNLSGLNNSILLYLSVSSTKNNNIIYTALDKGIGIISGDSVKYINPVDSNSGITENIFLSIAKTENYNFTFSVNGQLGAGSIYRISEKSLEEQKFVDSPKPPRTGEYYLGLMLISILSSLASYLIFTKIRANRRINKMP